jgi:hypothetical protein
MMFNKWISVHSENKTTLGGGGQCAILPEANTVYRVTM